MWEKTCQCGAWGQETPHPVSLLKPEGTQEKKQHQPWVEEIRRESVSLQATHAIPKRVIFSSTVYFPTFTDEEIM